MRDNLGLNGPTIKSADEITREGKESLRKMKKMSRIDEKRRQAMKQYKEKDEKEHRRESLERRHHSTHREGKSLPFIGLDQERMTRKGALDKYGMHPDMDKHIGDILEDNPVMQEFIVFLDQQGAITEKPYSKIIDILNTISYDGITDDDIEVFAMHWYWLSMVGSNFTKIKEMETLKEWVLVLFSNDYLDSFA